MTGEPNASPTSGWRRFWRFLAARIDRGSEVGLRLTIGVVVFAAATWTFGGLLEDVLEQESLVRWDIAVEAWFRSHATRRGIGLARAITQLGGPGVYAMIIVLGGILYVRRERFLLWSWLATTVGGVLVEFALKTGIHRQRPDHALALREFDGFSFPSGHAMMSLICFTMLVYVLGTIGEWSTRWRVTAFVAAALLAFTIGLTRIYLSVHYPSDVLGGFAAGLAWLSASLITMRLVRHDT